MEIWVLFGVFTLLMLIGTPIAFCLGVASLRHRALSWACRRSSSSSR